MTDTENSQIRELEGRLSEAARRHANDVKLIGDAMIEQANEHGWCAEYDKWVDALNRTLYIELPRRVTDFTADITVTVSFSTIPANAEPFAEDIAQAIYRHGDGWEGYAYTVDRSVFTDIQQV
jgi:hypothetical protein